MNQKQLARAAMEMASNTQPLLIYDGDCGFCYYWVRYWQKLTGKRVSYKPYQEVAAQHPSISVEEFQRSIQYVAPNGKISSGAEATFLTLNQATGKSIWLWLYYNLPGFALLAEFAYSFISTHRPFFYFLSRWLFGRNYEPPRYQLISWFFLRIIGLIYLAAFISFGTQALGLIGNHGIIPVTGLINAANQQLGIERYWFFPMVFWFNSSNIAIQITCWGGALLSLFVIFNFFPRINLIIMYVLYLSLCCAGQIFMSFQWDIYLLETGILALFLPSLVGIWLLRWLLFRFMFIAGMVKILSGDLTWQHLTALSYYFTTEPLPTPVAWYASHLPSTLLIISTASTLFIELVIPFLIFFPRRLRFISAFFILFLQTLILITGNYNFFNFLTMLLCLILFDDAALKKIIPKHLTSFKQQNAKQLLPRKLINFLVGVFVVFTISISLVQIISRFGGKVPTPIITVANTVAPLRIVNIYGPFSVMTTKRMEIIIEGSYDGATWYEYEFKYKPDDVHRRPPWNTPHQPRLDWQMWFAALSPPQTNPWFALFLQRLLENSPDVIALLKNNPFPNFPPTYVRAKFYDYQFTTYEEKKQTGNWWKRELMGLYFPAVHLK